MTTRARHLAAVVALALALGGCQDPYQNDQAHQAASSRMRPAQAPRPGDIDGPGPPGRPAPAGPVGQGSGARAVAAAFARGWTNWDWRTAAAQQLKLARLATGTLGTQLRSGARSTAADQSLARDRPGARGSVIAIDLKPDQRGVSGVVATREQTYTGGHADLGGRRYRVYLTTIEHGRHGWRVSRWEPQQ